MIGFIEVDIKNVRKAYNYLSKDDTFSEDDKEGLLDKLSNMNDIINTSAGRKAGKIFGRKERIKIKNMLEELVYSSFLSSSDHIILRVEMASIIQDIIYMYEEKPDIEDNTETNLEDVDKDDTDNK